MVPMEVAERDHVHRAGVETRRGQGRHDPGARHAALRPRALVQAVADTRLDQDAAGRRLDRAGS